MIMVIICRAFQFPQIEQFPVEQVGQEPPLVHIPKLSKILLTFLLLQFLHENFPSFISLIVALISKILWQSKHLKL